MKTYTVVFVVLALLVCAAPSPGQHQFKFDDPVKLVPTSREPRGQSLGIAWSGSVYAIVYDDYWWNKNKTGTYFLIVDANGKKVFGPKKLAKKQMGMDPKIVWAGDAFAILHPAGIKKGDETDYKYYLARYSTSGKKLSEYELDGIPTDDNSAIYCKLVWTGTDIGIFYYGDIPDKNIWSCHLFCKADSAGVPGKSVQILYHLYGILDVIWDGNRYLFLGAQVFGSGDEATHEVRIIVLDSEGNITTDQTYTDFTDIDFFQGVSIVQSHKKNKYLVAVGVVRPDDSALPPEAHWIDLYTTQVKVAGGNISGFNPKNVTASQKDDWSFPTLLRDGKNYYVTALLGTAGSCFGFAKMNAKGRIVSQPLDFQRPRPSCGCCPPYVAFGNKEVGVAFIYGDLYFNIVKP
jgi:hypothetical protein